MSRGPLETPLEANETEMVHSLSPGMVERLLPGEDVKFTAPSGDGPFSELAKHQLHAVAAAFGLTYDLGSGLMIVSRLAVDFMTVTSGGISTATFSGTKPGAANTNQWLYLPINGITYVIPAWQL